MKVLIITTAYKPELNPRAFRWSAVAEHWVANGHDVTVLCSSHPDEPADRIDAGVRVVRVGTSLLSTAGRKNMHRRPDTTAVESAQPLAVRRPSILKRIHDVTWKKVYWPDFACLWYPAARRAALELVEANDFDAVISVSVPFTGHLIGRAVKAKHPELRWLVDIGDPFSFGEGAQPNNVALYDKLNHAAERRILRAADAVVVTIESARRAYADFFPESAHKIVVIPPLLAVPEAVNGNGRLFTNDGRKRLVFAGTFYRELRSPEFMLKLFERLVARDPSLELHVLGSVRGCEDIFQQYTELLNRNLFVHGLVDRSKALRAQHEADVLVNIGNEYVYQLPSKLVEYAGSAKPILNLIRSPRDSSHLFFQFHPACVSVFTTDEPTEKDVDDIAQFIRTSRPVEPALLERTLASYRIDAIARRYEELVCAS